MANSFKSVACIAAFAGGSMLMAMSDPAAQPLPSPAAVTAAGVTLTSTTVDLPVGDRAFPGGPGVEVTQQNCTACHSVGMVMNQPSLSKAAWEGEVNKMRAVYKAPVDAADVPTIVAYLASIKGSP